MYRALTGTGVPGRAENDLRPGFQAEGPFAEAR